MDGEKAVEIARKTIDLWVEKGERYKPDSYPSEFNENMGVFVTLHTYPGRELRGCIGFPEPVYPLIKSLTEAAIAASTQDPRFEPLRKEDLGNVIVEVSVLTKPEIIKVEDPKDYPKTIEIGKDGLIVRSGFSSGLLLPQVATEYDWTPEEFLQNTCMKAGLAPDTWLEEGTEIFKFQSLIFSEEKPPNRSQDQEAA